jgi:aryl-alcohol dehydrogenase-like predicted oxidoreductase
MENPLNFLLEDNIASTIPEAAYRYCRHEPGVHVILTGTGNPDHLKANVESLLKPPLPAGALEHLREVFANVDSITGN